MISKSDVLLLLTELQEQGIDVTKEIGELYRSPNLSLDTLKKINDNKPLDLLSFYEKLRKSYNNHKSKLYINIMKSNENAIKNTSTVITTLSALLNQIYQFQTEDNFMFYSHARVDEIIKVLDLYNKSHKIEPALQLLTLIKVDIKALEMLK